CYCMWLDFDCGCCFFFQAEDGIRDDLVTGVQTCALPISCGRTTCPVPQPAKVWEAITTAEGLGTWFGHKATVDLRVGGLAQLSRSEERRVGKEWRSRRCEYRYQHKTNTERIGQTMNNRYR